jgi:hypothetical protein
MVAGGERFIATRLGFVLSSRIVGCRVHPPAGTFYRCGVLVHHEGINRFFADIQGLVL